MMDHVLVAHRVKFGCARFCFPHAGSLPRLHGFDGHSEERRMVSAQNPGKIFTRIVSRSFAGG